VSLPEALPLSSVSPSRFNDLAECALRVTFKQHAALAATKSDPQLIGDSLHGALAACIKSGEFARADIARLVEARFLGELEKEAPGREVRGTRVAAARLKKIVARVVDLVAEAGPGAVALSEEPLAARGDALQGVVDLIIESERLHVIVDYKTGRATDDEGEITPHFQIQVQLYAVLEHERSGRWPERAILLRFGGPPLSIDVDPADCEIVADRAVDALAAYNALIGTVPPASASEATCRYCSYAPRCPAFWDAISPSWVRGAVRGRVAWAERSAAGGLTVALTDSTGSYEGTVVIRRLSEEQIVLGALPIGAELAVCGVYPDGDGRLVPARSASLIVANASE
jgi:CRISPR/Cas system-associated exonuclease Cas4 (RecB family)